MNVSRDKKVLASFLVAAVTLQCFCLPGFCETEESKAPALKLNSQEKVTQPNIREYKDGIPIDDARTPQKIETTASPITEVKESGANNKTKVTPIDIKTGLPVRNKTKNDRYPLLYDAVPPYEIKQSQSIPNPTSKELNHPNKESRVSPYVNGYGPGYGPAGGLPAGDHDFTLRKKIYDPRRIAK